MYVGNGNCNGNVCVLCMSVCACQWGASLVSWGSPGTLACVSHLRPSTQEESTLTFSVLSLLYYERPFNPYHQTASTDTHFIADMQKIALLSLCSPCSDNFLSTSGHAFSLSTDKWFEMHLNYVLKWRLLNHPIVRWMLRIHYVHFHYSRIHMRKCAFDAFLWIELTYDNGQLMM